MKKLWLLSIIVISTVFFIPSCSSVDDESQTQNNEEPIILDAASMLNVSYGNDPQQVYDIYLPEGRTQGNTKVLILVHGGGWTGGDKSDMDGFISFLQEFHPDHAIVNMNYILATAIIPAFPNQFLDLDNLINHISASQEELQILPEYGLIGISAGAHISLMYDYVYDDTDVVKMVCDIVGPTNFTDPFYANNPGFQLLLDLLVDESAYPDGTDYAAATSPALQVSFESSPSLLFYGNQDPLVPLTNGELLNDNLSTKQITHSFTVYDGGHFDWDQASFLDLQQKLSAFINTHLAIPVD
ncbi:MAG: acetyl esterase/lipase [Candidatus Latescibacterota bacterium]|jgi:acetyl esterase/lipase